VPKDDPFFRALGARIRELRQNHGLSQEDMPSRGFQVRYWQKIEAGKAITVRTLLKICRIFSTPMDQVVKGLDGISAHGRLRKSRSKKQLSAK